MITSQGPLPPARLGAIHVLARGVSSHGLRSADDWEVGSLWINEASRFRLDMYPFGGVKQSGIGREGVEYAMEELSQVKFIGIRPGAS
jgi:acyl-CoA reductase-like NAD-dependent aldehyde dehydrogenase